MHSYLKQSTASQTRVIGPFVDDTDFTTAETALSIANTDVKLSKNGGASANKNSGGGTHVANGMYALTFDATDTATVGELSGSILVSGALVVPFKFTVLEEVVYDALFGAGATGLLPANVTQAAGQTVSATGAVDFDDLATILEDTSDLQGNQGDWATATSVTVSDKEGFKLASDGLSLVTAWTVGITGNVSGSVGSVTGSVGSVTGTVGGIAGTITTLDALDTAQDTQHNSTQSAIAGISAGSAPTLLQTATIGTLNSQTSFTLSAGSADDSAYSKQLAIIVDQSTSTQKTVCNISAYTGATKTVTLNESPRFTVAAGDTVYVVAASKTTLDDDTINSLTGTLVTFSAPTFTSGGWDRDFIKGNSYIGGNKALVFVQNWGGDQLLSAASEMKLSGTKTVDGTTTSFEWGITPGDVTVDGTTTTIPIVLSTTDTNIDTGEYTADIAAKWTSPEEVTTIVQPKFKLRIVQPVSTF